MIPPDRFLGSNFVKTLFTKASQYRNDTPLTNFLQLAIAKNSYCLPKAFCFNSLLSQHFLWEIVKLFQLCNLFGPLFRQKSERFIQVTPCPLTPSPTPPHAFLNLFPCILPPIPSSLFTIHRPSHPPTPSHAQTLYEKGTALAREGEFLFSKYRFYKGAPVSAAASVGPGRCPPGTRTPFPP